jgi:hypothetical protein
MEKIDYLEELTRSRMTTFFTGLDASIVGILQNPSTFSLIQAFASCPGM